ncbi:MAG: uroporphyrinogen-III synthase [Desertimonas sp.]
MRVALTRPSTAGLGDALIANGAEVVHVPLIAIGPPPDGGAELAGALAQLGRFEWLVVTSPNGVRAVTDHVDLAGVAVRLAAVGPATGRALAIAARRSIDLLPTDPRGEGLVAEFPPGTARVLVAQADRAAPTVVDGLRAAGHEVRAVTAYVTTTRRPTDEELRRLRGVDAVLLASPSAVEGWCRAVEPAVADRVRPLIVAIGPTTAAAAATAGIGPDAVAETPDADGVMAALARAPGTRSDARRATP